MLSRRPGHGSGRHLTDDRPGPTPVKSSTPALTCLSPGADGPCRPVHELPNRPSRRSGPPVGDRAPESGSRWCLRRKDERPAIAGDMRRAQWPTGVAQTVICGAFNWPSRREPGTPITRRAAIGARPDFWRSLRGGVGPSSRAGVSVMVGRSESLVGARQILTHGRQRGSGGVERVHHFGDGNGQREGGCPSQV